MVEQDTIPEKLDIAAKDSPINEEANAKVLRRKLLWKLDTRYAVHEHVIVYVRAKACCRVLPPITILYLCAFFDRSNVGNAKILGLEDDLSLVGTQYATALAVFYVFYVVSDVPSNLLLKKATPRIWLSSLAILWGICTLGIGFVRNYAQFFALRCLLGLFEGGLYPGSLLYLSTM